MKKLRNIMFVFLLILGIIFISLSLLFNHYTSPVGGSNEMIEVIIPENSSGEKIGKILEEKDLIRSTTFFKIYLKLFNIKKLNNGKYSFNKEMSLREIIDKLQETNYSNDAEISITFQEGITMRKIASIIASKTENTEEDVFNLLNNKDYLDKLINEYWFITDKILDNRIYYPLEGYLFPDTYRFTSNKVKVEDIFNKMLKKMDTVLTPLKDKIEKSDFNIHEILTLASMAEKEENKKEYRDEIVSVFVNRIKRGMSLGSDVTTRYALKIDDAKQVLKRSEYAFSSPYNTRLTDGSMNGKLPIGPISTVSESSILAAVDYAETDYIYFIANINSNETFFFSNANDFERKKNELSKVNGGL